MDEVYFEFSKIPINLIVSLEESYQKIKEDIINILKEELIKEYGIEIRNIRREQIQQPN